MSAAASILPILSVGKLSDGRYKFSFATHGGTLFSEVSVAKITASPDSRSDDDKKSEALKALHRLVRDLDAAIAESVEGHWKQAPAGLPSVLEDSL
jgi:hypothetical protein